MDNTQLDAIVDEAAREVLESSDGDTASGLYSPIVVAALKHLVVEHAVDPAGELEACFKLDRDTAERLLALGAGALDDPELVDLSEILSDYLYGEDAFVGFERRLLDLDFLVAGYSSMSFAAMTAGSSTVRGLQWRDRVFFREIGGEDAVSDIGGWQVRNYAGDVAARRTALLGIIEGIGGLASGVYFGSECESEFANEIRRITEDRDSFAEELNAIVAFEEDDFDFLEEHVEEYARANHLPESEARSVLERLTQDLEPRDRAERDALWRIWLDVRVE